MGSRLGFEFKSKSVNPSCFTDKEIKPTHIIIHCCGYKEDKALKILSGHDGVSASTHYFVPQADLKKTPDSHQETLKYPIYQLVSDNKKAWHAGVSQWKDIESFNDCSIGIEFHAPNYAYALERSIDNLDWNHFEEFPSDQIEAGITLILQLMAKYKINSEHVLTHADISPWKKHNHHIIPGKTDPGATFPMERLAKLGIGVWPRFERTRTTDLVISIDHCRHLLREFGYHIPKNTDTEFNKEDIDAITRCCIKAFKIHFMPEAYLNDVINDEVNEKMIIGLENLIDKKYKYEIISHANEHTARIK